MILMKIDNKTILNGFVVIMSWFAVYASSKQLPGEIYPPNVELEVGDSINITCQLNPDILRGYNASDLKFWKNDTRIPIPAEDVIILNSTTIMYMLRNAKAQVTSLVCTCRNDGIQISKIYVGYKPLAVTDFACRSYDFEYMICNFTQPFNHIMTTYNLSYYVDTPHYKYYPHCNYDAKPHIVCNTTLRNQAFYNFILHGANELGNRYDNFTFNNWEIMAPSKPGDRLRVLNLSNNTLTIVWRMPKWDKYRTKGLCWEVLLKPDKFTARNLSSVVNVAGQRGEMHLTINDLPYAWYWYELNLRVRINVPNSPWSESFTYRFRTAAKKPSRPPRVERGGFYIDSTETQIRLYWEQLKDYEENGDNFTYIVSKIKRNGEIFNQEPLRLESNSAKFTWNKYSVYEFEIRSKNSIGESENASQLIIQPFSNRNIKRYMPRSIQNVYHATNDTYTLTWQPPIELENLEDYTVYWCFSKPALQNECKDSIHFINLAKDVHEFTTFSQTTQQEHTLNLAVSANYKEFNSGMHWTDCTQDVNSDLEKMEPEVHAINATSIKIQWSTERVCPSILIGYNISYCMVYIANSLADCVDEPHIVSIDNNAKKFELTSLKPYTNYKIEMLMYSHLKVGKLSEPQVVRTYEAMPSPPEHLQLLHIGNTSATISWLPPSQPNGILRAYTINLNNKTFELIISDAADAYDKVNFNLTNLSSFTSYRVYVLAHNSLMSKPSNPVYFTTRIGIPSIPGSATPMRENNTIIQWSKPKVPSGRLEYYEVLISQFQNDHIVKSFVNYIMTNTSCVLRQLPVCPSAEYKTTVQVRAVNAARITHEVDMDVDYNKAESMKKYVINDDGEEFLRCENISPREAQVSPELIERYQNKNMYRLYKSEWQMGSSYSCSANRYSKITTAALLTIILIVGIMCIGYLAGKKFKKMANIHCTLPEGLESYFEKSLCSNSNSSAAILNDDDIIGYSHTDYVKSVLDDEFHLVNGNRSFENKREPDQATEHEQEQQLLETGACNDSGYLGGLRTFETCTPQFQKYDEDQMQQKHYHSSLTKSMTSVDSLDDDTLSLGSDNVIPKSTQDLNNIESAAGVIVNGYIKPENLINWPQQAQSQQICDTSSYITVDAMKAKSGTMGEPANIGYMNPNQLQNNTFTHIQPSNTANNLSGYTTLGELEQVMRSDRNILPPTPLNNIGQQEPFKENVTTQISGYVTQQDLNIFSKKQNHFNHQHLAQPF